MKVSITCLRLNETNVLESSIVYHQSFDDVSAIIPCSDGFSVVLDDSLLQYVYKHNFYYSLGVED